MTTDTDYHPIRTRAFWVGLVQSLVTVLVLAGLAAEIVEGWAQVALAIVNVAVIVGALAKGSTDAEENTTPLDDAGNPLNPNYIYSPPA